MPNTRYYLNDADKWCYRTREGEDDQWGFDTMEEAVEDCMLRAERLGVDQPARTYIVNECGIDYDAIFKDAVLIKKGV